MKFTLSNIKIYVLYSFVYVSPNQGVDSKNGYFGGKKNSSGNLQILLGTGRLEKFPETQSNEVKILGILRYFGECLPKIWDNIPDFKEELYLHMVLLKQCLLELSPPIASPNYLPVSLTREQLRVICPSAWWSNGCCTSLLIEQSGFISPGHNITLCYLDKALMAHM